MAVSMNDWNIQSRASACESCAQPFADQQALHTLLFDEHTDREAAHAAMGATGARFVWHDARQRSRGARERVLALLLEGSPGPSP